MIFGDYDCQIVMSDDVINYKGSCLLKHPKLWKDSLPLICLVKKDDITEDPQDNQKGGKDDKIDVECVLALH